MLGQRLDWLQLLLAPSALPIRLELITVQSRSLGDQAERAPR
jgi:hypothetical protein